MSEAGDLNGKLTALQEETVLKGQQIEVLVKKVNKRQQRIVSLKRVIEEMAAKIGILDQQLSETTHQKDLLNEVAKKLEGEFGELRKKWEPMEKACLSPGAILEMLQKSCKKESSVFEESGSLEEDICKLHSILTVKLKEYKVIGETPDGDESSLSKSRPHSTSCGNQEECKLDGESPAKERKTSNELESTPTGIRNVSEVLKLVECPFKSQTKVLQGLVDEFKGKVTILEKKERVLEKIMNTSVIFV